MLLTWVLNELGNNDNALSQIITKAVDGRAIKFVALALKVQPVLSGCVNCPCSILGL
jgi:hypothetical protein